MTLNNLAVFYKSRTAKAGQLYKRALRIFEKGAWTETPAHTGV
jgi:hypothetical protein